MANVFAKHLLSKGIAQNRSDARQNSDFEGMFLYSDITLTSISSSGPTGGSLDHPNSSGQRSHLLNIDFHSTSATSTGTSSHNISYLQTFDAHLTYFAHDSIVRIYGKDF